MIHSRASQLTSWSQCMGGDPAYIHAKVKCIMMFVKDITDSFIAFLVQSACHSSLVILITCLIAVREILESNGKFRL